MSCARSGKWAKAQRYASTALELDSGNDEYRYHLQVVDARVKLFEADQLLVQEPPALNEAAELLQQATVLDPLSFEAFYRLGLVFAALERLDEAAVSAREALRLDPSHPAARRLFADINRRRRKLAMRSGVRKRKRNR